MDRDISALWYLSLPAGLLSVLSSSWVEISINGAYFNACKLACSEHMGLGVVIQIHRFDSSQPLAVLPALTIRRDHARYVFHLKTLRCASVTHSTST